MAQPPVKEILPIPAGARSRQVIRRVLLIVVVGFWTLSPVLRNDWIMDDFVYYPQNPLLGDPHRLWKIWVQPGSFIEYYPIESTAGYFQWKLWHDIPLGYHLTNIVLHLLSAFLIWRLLSKFDLRLAWLGGLLFAVHPALVESVSYLAEIKNTLSLPPFLLAMCAWIDYEERGRKRDYLLALVLFLVAMLCKITMMLFPATILLYAWWKRGRVTRKDLRVSAPFFIISLVLVTVTILASERYIRGHMLQVETVPVGGFFPRVALAGLSLSFYFSRCFLPLDSLPIYPLWRIDPPSLLQFVPWPIMGAAFVWLWQRRRGWGRHALLGLGFFVINLAPFLGVKTISYMSFTWVMDHFLYLPIIGLIGLVVAGLGDVDGRLSASVRIFGRVLVALVVAALAFESHAYAGKFINEQTLWTYTISRNPDAWPARNSLGTVLLVSGRVSEAIEQYQLAAQISPDVAEVRYNLGLAFMNAGRKREAIAQFEQALKLQPNSTGARDYLNALLAEPDSVRDKAPPAATKK